MKHVSIMFPNINGAPRGKLIAQEHFSLDKTFAMACLVLIDDIEGNEAPGATNKWVPAEDTDIILKPDPATAIDSPMHPEASSMVMVDVLNEKGQEIPITPRAMLKNALAWYEEHDIQVKIASELEFYLVREDGSRANLSAGRQTPYADINAIRDSQQLLEELVSLTRQLGLTPEGIVKEDCQDQFEITFEPEEPLFMADRVLYFKQLARDVAAKHGLRVSFMSQPFGNSCGSGAHVHYSLWRDGTSLMQPNSDELNHALAGNLRYMRSSAVLFAPNPNSFRRWNLWGRGAKKPGASHEARQHAAIRITKHGQHGAHLEYRLGGADINAHLAYAAILGSAAQGLEQQLQLDDPSVVEQTEQLLPMSLTDALQLLESEDAADIFDTDFIASFVAIKRRELESFNRAVTDWERRAYEGQV